MVPYDEILLDCYRYFGAYSSKSALNRRTAPLD